MMMAEGSSEVLVGLKVTRYFSHGENSMNCNLKKKKLWMHLLNEAKFAKYVVNR
jgi:hypothetical protein